MTCAWCYPQPKMRPSIMLPRPGFIKEPFVLAALQVEERAVGVNTFKKYAQLLVRWGLLQQSGLIRPLKQRPLVGFIVRWRVAQGISVTSCAILLLLNVNGMSAINFCFHSCATVPATSKAQIQEKNWHNSICSYRAFTPLTCQQTCGKAWNAESSWCSPNTLSASCSSRTFPIVP